MIDYMYDADKNEQAEEDGLTEEEVLEYISSSVNRIADEYAKLIAGGGEKVDKASMDNIEEWLIKFNEYFRKLRTGEISKEDAWFGIVGSEAFVNASIKVVKEKIKSRATKPPAPPPKKDDWYVMGGIDWRYVGIAAAGILLVHTLTRR